MHDRTAFLMARGLPTLIVLLLSLSFLLVVHGEWTSMFQQDTASGTSMGRTPISMGPSTPLVAAKALLDGTGYLLMSTNYIWKLDQSFNPVFPWGGTNESIQGTPINGGIDFCITKGGGIVVLEKVDTLVRLTKDGVFDTNFGDSGRLTISSTNFTMVVSQTVLVDDSDRVYVFGTKWVDDGGGGQHFHAFRLDQSGHYLDTTFFNQGFWEWTLETGGSDTALSAGTVVASTGDLVLCGTLNNVQPQAAAQVTLFKFSQDGSVTKSEYQGSNERRCNMRITKDGYVMTVTESSSSVQFFKWDLSSLTTVGSWIPPLSFNVNGSFSLDVEDDGSLLVAFKEGFVYSNGQFLRLPPGGGLPLTLNVAFASVYPLAVFSLPASPTASQRFAVVADSDSVYYFGNVYPCTRPLVSASQLAYLPSVSDLTLSLSEAASEGLMTSLIVRELIPSRLPLYLLYRNPDNYTQTYPLTSSYAETIISGSCVFRVDALLPLWYKQSCFVLTAMPIANLFSSVLEVTWIENVTVWMGVRTRVVSRTLKTSFTVNLWLPAVVQEHTPTSFDLSATRLVEEIVIGDVSFVRTFSSLVDFHVRLLLFTQSAVIVTRVYNSAYNLSSVSVVLSSDGTYNIWEWVVPGVCNITGTYTFDVAFTCVDGGQTCVVEEQDLSNKVEKVSVTMDTDSACAVASASPYTAEAYVNLMNAESVPTRNFQEIDQMIKARTWAVVSPPGGPQQESVSVIQVKLNSNSVPSESYMVDSSVAIEPVVSLPFSTVRSNLTIGTNVLQVTLLIRFEGGWDGGSSGGGVKRSAVSLLLAKGEVLRSVVETEFIVLELASPPSLKITSTTTTFGPSSGLVALAATAMVLTWLFEGLCLV